MKYIVRVKSSVVRTGLSRAGFSLIEMLVAVGILGVISVAMSAALNQQINTTNYLYDSMARNSFQREIQLLLDTPDICSATLGGFRLDLSNPKVLPSIKDKAGNVLYDTGAKKGYERLEIARIEVENNNAAAGSSGLVNVLFSLHRTRKGGGSASFKKLSVPVLVNVDASLDVTSCGDSNPLSIYAKINAAFGGVATYVPDNTYLTFKTGKPNQSSGNINVRSKGIEMAVEGCYRLGMTTRVGEENLGTTLNTGGFRVEYQHKSKTTGAEKKLNWISIPGADLKGFPDFYMSKYKSWFFEVGDRFQAKVTKNDARAGVMLVAIEAQYLSATCN